MFGKKRRQARKEAQVKTELRAQIYSQNYFNPLNPVNIMIHDVLPFNPTSQVDDLDVDSGSSYDSGSDSGGSFDGGGGAIVNS